MPRDRGLKAWKGRGNFEKDAPMIICVHQRGEGMTYFDVHDTKESLISKVRRLIDRHHHAKVYTDEYLAYKNLKKYGFVHKQIRTSAAKAHLVFIASSPPSLNIIYCMIT